MGAAGAIAAQLPGDAGRALLAAAGDSFTDAMAIGLLVAAGVALVAALVAARFLSEAASDPRPKMDPFPEQRQRAGSSAVGAADS